MIEECYSKRCFCKFVFRWLFEIVEDMNDDKNKIIKYIALTCFSEVALIWVYASWPVVLGFISTVMLITYRKLHINDKELDQGYTVSNCGGVSCANLSMKVHPMKYQERSKELSFL